ncbi:PepSY domain-containing protein [Acetobacteraceae bacterium]|nr:PepSY domain-containing protein [Acetobacteraceae bacterium]
MPETLRKTFAKWHHWIGVFCASLLAIFCLTGGLCTIGPAFDHWVSPLPPSISKVFHTPSAESVAVATEYMEQTRGEAPAFLRLPTPQDPVFRLIRYDGNAFQTILSLHPETGLPFKDKPSLETGFFIALHSTLYLNRKVIDFIGLFVSLAGLGAVISGILIHWKRLKSDFQLLRLFSPTPRRALDFHLFCTLIALPFLLTALVTGVWIESQHLVEDFSPRPVISVTETESQKNLPAHLPPEAYKELYQAGAHYWGKDNQGFFLIAPHQALLVPSDGKSISLTRPHLALTQIGVKSWNIAPSTDKNISLTAFVKGLHLMRWATGEMRWVVSLSAVLLWAALGAGSFLLLMKQRSALNRRNACPSRSDKIAFSFAESFALSAFGLLPLTLLGLLWLEWLSPKIPLSLSIHAPQGRVDAFFCVWIGLSLIGLAFSLFRWVGSFPFADKALRLLWKITLKGSVFFALALPFITLLGREWRHLPLLPNTASLLLEGHFVLFGLILFMCIRKNT